MSRAIVMPHAPSSVTDARRSLCSDLDGTGLDGGKVNDAALILSELLSNALRHASPLPAPFPPQSVRVSWRVVTDTGDPGSGWLEISVCDGGGETLPRIARPSLSALGGRGLGIVQYLAATWGTEVDDDTTTVWAVLEVPSDGFPTREAEPAFDRTTATPADTRIVEVPLFAEPEASTA